MFSIQQTLTSLLIFSVIFAVLDKLFSFHKQKIFRREWGTDLCFFLGQYLLWSTTSLIALSWVSDCVGGMGLHNFQQMVKSQPLWLQIFEVILLCDIGIYWGHRISHKYEILWRFHKVHHTSEKLDWIAAYREHPLDNIYTRVIENLPAMLMGFPLELIAGLIMLRGLWGLVIHSNCDFNLGIFKYVLGSPRLHHWHHELEHSGKVNFANLMPLMDVIFGTYHDPEEKPEKYGIPEDVSHNYVVQIVSPLIPGFMKKRRQKLRDSVTISE